MSLRDVTIKKEYRSLLDNVVRDFYVPLLSEAISYKRAVGFFSSSVLVEISKGIANLIKNGGHIQLIASPHLSEEDIAAIREGYSKREIIKASLLKSLTMPKNTFQADRLNLLANLIADGYLDIKIAMTTADSQFGMYHEKMGIIEDAYGNKVAFSGSMNESANALLLNYETIDVYTSWSEDFDRVQTKECSFISIWNDAEPNIQTMDFSDITDEIVKKYKRQPVDYTTLTTADEELVMDNVKNSFFVVPDTVSFYDYQKDAIDSWIKHSCRGIFDMATGAGKTFTALGSISKLSEILNGKLGVIIVAPYQHLVEQWVEDITAFGVKPIICYSRYDWKKKLKDAVKDYKYKIINNFCAITTNATLATDSMQSILKNATGDMLIVVDEAHNFGTRRQMAAIPIDFKYRLGLSATIERHHDEEGTQRLYDFFGPKCIEYTLKQAIEEGKLTPYHYYPIAVSLNESEFDKYVEITDKVVSILRKNRNKDEIPKAAEHLLIERARIIAGCQNKLEALKVAINPYKNKHRILVYCGATKVFSIEEKKDVDDAFDGRQIDIVTQMLGCDLDMIVTQFTSAEDSKERDVIKTAFANDNIQALVAIKCLDEGMNIPGIETAFILASSTNPKEYIQRRGRVLRKFPGKNYAEIFDFITLPHPLDAPRIISPTQAELSLIKREVERIRDFQELAENPYDSTLLLNELTRQYNLYNIGEDYGKI